jgi:cell wall-associated NlpC family hydrolase
LIITVFAVPVTNSWVKLFQMVLLLITFTAWFAVLGRMGRIVLLLGIVSTASLFLLPARSETSRANLAEAYDHALLRYVNVTYWWGGENSVGIDCSGLIRRGMMDATLHEGLRKFDGGLLRASADLWWHDSSAEALGESYRGWTTFVTSAKSLNDLDHSLARPGDLAIAGGGVHILAYLGDHRWIQADPNEGKVIVETAPSKNYWFKGPVKIIRWKWLSVAT